MAMQEHPLVGEAESIVRDANRQRIKRRKRNGFIAAGTLSLSLLTGSTVWGAPSHQAQACQPVFAGRAGMIPCPPPNTPTDDTIEKIIGTTTTGCVVGFTFGLVPGMWAGCVGGLVGNIAW